MTRISILGPGGVGGLVAAALTRAGEEVVVVARESTAARIAERGIRVTSVRLGDFTARPSTDRLGSGEHATETITPRQPGKRPALELYC